MRTRTTVCLLAICAAIVLAGKAGAVPFTIPFETLAYDAEFSHVYEGGGVIRTVVGGEIQFEFIFSGAPTEDRKVLLEDDYPILNVYGQSSDGRGHMTNFSAFDGYTLALRNVNDMPIMMALCLNTGLCGPSGVPTNDLRNDTFWQSPWVWVEPGELKTLILDFARAIPWNVADNPLPHTQGGEDGVPMAINAYDLQEVDSIGFMALLPAGNPPVDAVIPEPATLSLAAMALAAAFLLRRIHSTP